MTARRHDAILVGGGHNGLVAAGYLARAGLDVLVLERRDVVGGPCGVVEYFPGYTAAITNSPGSLEPRVVADMRLEEFGLAFSHPDPTMVAPFPDGRAFVTWRDKARVEAELAKFSAHDARAYGALFDFFGRFAERLGVSLFEPPPSFRELTARLETPEDEAAFAAIMFGSVQDLLDEYLEADEIKAVVATLSTNSSQAGPSTPGSAYLLLQRPLSLASMPAEAGGYDPRQQVMRGSTGLPVGGMGAITQAMRRSIEASGATVRTGAEVVQIMVRDGAVRGVVLGDGEEIEAGIVLSNANPKLTYLDLVDARDLEPDFRERVARIPMAGSAFKVGLALDGLPRFAAARTDEEARLYAGCQFRIAPSMEYLERAYDDCKHGRPSRGPVIWGLTPSVMDPGLAPPGKHVMSLNVFHAPYHLAEGDWATEREVFGEHCIDTLAQYIPNLRDIVTDKRFWSPRDLEREFGLLEANITHGDMVPGRLFSQRPLAGWADYRTPIAGLYLCGVGTWPGGFVSGIPGHNASHQVLRDLGAAKRGAAAE